MATFLGYLAQFILTLGSQRQKEVIFATQSRCKLSPFGPKTSTSQ
jgi:hypothetical protein